MERLLKSQVKQVLSTGVMVFQKDALNSSFQDIARYYLVDVLPEALITKLLDCECLTGQPDQQVSFHIYTPTAYKSFLQMITIEDYTEACYTAKTVFHSCVFSQSPQPLALATFRNTPTDNKRYESILNSEYAQFKKDKAHLFHIVTEQRDAGKLETLCEYILYSPLEVEL